jgi:acyl carrier protein
MLDDRRVAPAPAHCDLEEPSMNINGTIDPASVDSLKSWLVDWLAEALAMDGRQIDQSQPFLSYGLDSVQAMSMVGDLEATFGGRLPPTLAWDYPSVDAMAEHLAGRLGRRAEAAPAAARAQAESQASRSEIEGLLAGIEHLDEAEVDRLLARYLGGPR